MGPLSHPARIGLGLLVDFVRIVISLFCLIGAELALTGSGTMATLVLLRVYFGILHPYVDCGGVALVRP